MLGVAGSGTSERPFSYYFKMECKHKINIRDLKGRLRCLFCGKVLRNDVLEKKTRKR